jgi:hypothetical protein
MAMSAMKQILATGTATGLAAPGTTETTSGIDDLILHVKTAGTGTTVTFTDPGLTPAGSSPTNPAVVVASTAEVFIAVNQLLTSNTTGLITATFSSVATVTAEWLRM